MVRVPNETELRAVVEVELASGVVVTLRVGGKSQIVVEPSVHTTGSSYTWKRPLPANLGEVPICPPLLWDAIVAQASAARRDPAAPAGENGGKVREGKRNHHLFRLGGGMRARGASPAEIEAALQVRNREDCDPLLSEAEVRELAKNASRYPRGAEDPSEPAGSVGSVEDPWESPVEFGADEYGPPVPLEAFPSKIAAYVQDVAEVNRAPLDFAATISLGVLASAGARRYEVQIGSTHREPLNLYMAPTAPPGERKYLLRELAFPLEQEERRLDEGAKPEIARITSERALAEARADALRKKAAREKDAAKRAELAKEVKEIESELPEVPARPRLFLDDATTEYVARELAAQGGRIGVISEEAGTLFEMMCGRYREGVADLDVYLKGYDGGQIRVGRMGREGGIVERPAITILVTPQPTILDRLAEREELRGRGLLGRFCFVLSPSLVGTRLYRNRSLDAVLRSSYASAIGAILRLPLAAPDAIQRLRIEGEALDVWARFADAIELDQADGKRLASIRDWASKHAGRVARIAGLFHLAEHAPPRTIPELISAETVAAAWAVGEWLQGHALCAFAQMGADPRVVMAKRVLAWIRRRRRDRFTLRDLHQDFKNTASPNDLLPPLEILEGRGFVRRVEREPGPKGGRKPSLLFIVNPLTHTTEPTQPPEEGSSVGSVVPSVGSR